MCGLPGVGKTTVAKRIAPLLNAVVLSTDKIRKELFHTPSYSRRERKLIYDILVLLAKYLCNSNVSCILDATFSKEKSRQEIRNKLRSYSKEINVIECICAEDIIIDRLKLRKHDYSDADLSVYTSMKRIYEPVKGNHITVDTSRLSPIDIERIASHLRSGNSNGSDATTAPY
jgi:predicted kinase